MIFSCVFSLFFWGEGVFFLFYIYYIYLYTCSSIDMILVYKITKFLEKILNISRNIGKTIQKRDFLLEISRGAT